MKQPWIKWALLVGVWLIVAIVLLVIVLSSRKEQASQEHVYLPQQVNEMQAQAFIPALNKPQIKKGLSTACYSSLDELENDLRITGVGWYYNWSVAPPLWPGIESVPMIWDEDYVNKSIGGNSRYILGFNEPDWPGQAELTPAQAVPLWEQIEQLHPGRLLGSPSNSDLNPGWLDEFRELYLTAYGEYPRLDVLVLHCYQEYAEGCISYFESQVNRATAWGIPEIWVTEFGIWNDVTNGGAAVIDYMSSEPMITRYSIFTNRAWCLDEFWWRFSLFLQDGKITDLGSVYLPTQY